MALERLDPSLERALSPLVERLDGVDPNRVTWVGCGVGLLAAGALALGGPDLGGRVALALAAVLLPAQYGLDVLDGTVARRFGRATRWGDYLDHTLDRVVDVAVVIATGVLAGSIPLGLAAAVAMLLGSHAGTQSQASGLRRPLGGFSRLDRLVLLAIVAAIGAIAPAGVGMAARAALWAVGAGGVVTLLWRSGLAWRAMRAG